MRRLGYGVIDAIVDRVTGLRDQPATRPTDRTTMAQRLREPAPEHGSEPMAVLARALSDVLADGMRVDHPRFLAYVPSPSNFVGAMADALASGFNVFAGMWIASPGAAEVELVAVDWLRQWCGLPDGTGGIFLSGGSMANLVALAVARHARFGGDPDAARKGVVYCSDQTHASIGRALRTLGFGADRVRRLPTDGRFRLAPECLARAVAEDRAAGLTPYCLVANAGATTTGAVDPLPELADLCSAEGLWLHVDGAFGAAAVLADAGRAALAGLDRADSLTLDPHKWLFQPIECGCLLVRDRQFLRAAFYERPEYLRDVDSPGRSGEEVNFYDLGPQLTRGFRALKLWMSVQVFGVASFRAAVAHGIALAELAERHLRHDSTWDVVTPAQLGIVTFRHRFPGRTATETDELNARIARASVDDGAATISSSVLSGRTVLRLCAINPRTTVDDIEETIRLLSLIGSSLASENHREAA
jgi:glutamate/tyrosine decarboxylase-like PLP-dependent enzyme